MFQRRSDGIGVDAVLNTLGSEFLHDNLAVLRRGGTLVDLGHPAVLDLESQSKRAAAAGVEFVNFHIAADVAVHESDTLRAILIDVARRLEEGSLLPIPHRALPLSEVRTAFETMLRGSHVGKIVVTHPAAIRADLPVSNDGTYLITGGLGALGLQFAEWLVERGARHVALMGRRKASDGVMERVRVLEERATVTCVEADVTDAASLARALSHIEATMAPLRGVIHAAGIVDDGVIPQQTWARFEAVLAPKVRGAWMLHQKIGPRPLDFFVLVSSSAGLWGNPGQASYGAANAFLDQLAHARRQQGLTALSIDFGAWSGSGMAGELSDAARRRRAESGVSDLAPEGALQAMGAALRRDARHAGVFHADWAKFAQQFEPAAAKKFAELIPAPGRTDSDKATSPDAPRTFEDTVQRIARHVGALAGVQGDIDTQAALPDLGLDSLAVLLLRGRLIAEFGEAAALPVVRFLERRNVTQLAGLIFGGETALVRPSIRETAAKAIESNGFRHLALIRAGGSRLPLFLLPPAGRTTLALAALADALHDDRPIYGFNPAGLDEGSAPHHSVEAMAAAYLAEVRAARPEGPYALAGVCFGAHVALEMAARLLEGGQEVPALVLIDSGPPHARTFVRSPMAVSRFYYERVVHHLRERSLRRTLASRVQELSRGRELARTEDDAVTGQAVDRVLRAHAIARRSYRAGLYPGRAVILLSEEFARLRVAERWGLLTRHAIEKVVVAGTTHSQLLSVSFAPDLARVVTASIDAAAPPADFRA